MTLSYLAGFFDGEGCANVATRKRKDSTYITQTLIASNNVRSACVLFIKALGVGRVYEVRPGHYQWRANNREAATKLLPYLKIKKTVVQKMIDVKDYGK